MNSALPVLQVQCDRQIQKPDTTSVSAWRPQSSWSDSRDEVAAKNKIALTVLYE